MKILVVDDTRIILSVIEAILTQDHQEIFTATDGKAGFTAFYDILPDMVITDIEMPWQDGLSMMQSIRKTHPDTPTIYMTGNPGPYQQRMDDEQKTYSAGILYKPFTRADLLRAVNDVACQDPPMHPNILPLHHPCTNGSASHHLTTPRVASLSAASFQGERRYAKAHRFIINGSHFTDNHIGNHG